MGIGTGNGKYYEDEFEYQLAQVKDPLDFTDQFNTPLNKDQQTEFDKKFSPGDKYDYDMQGWFKANPDVNMAEGQHFPDTFKKPNHPTFSDESIYHGGDYQGGTWGREGNQDTFTPGGTNLDMHGLGKLQDYFDKTEPDVKLKQNTKPLNEWTDNEIAQYQASEAKKAGQRPPKPGYMGQFDISPYEDNWSGVDPTMTPEQSLQEMTPKDQERFKSAPRKDFQPNQRNLDYERNHPMGNPNRINLETPEEDAPGLVSPEDKIRKLAMDIKGIKNPFTKGEVGGGGAPLPKPSNENLTKEQLKLEKDWKAMHERYYKEAQELLKQWPKPPSRPFRVIEGDKE